MSDVTASSDDGEDYVYGGGQLQEIKRYPVHDCCEFEDVESLRVSWSDGRSFGTSLVLDGICLIFLCLRNIRL